MDNPFSLQHKIILVTGASSGIGRAMAISCAGMGATVILTGRSLPRLEETMAMMELGDHFIITADLTNEEDRNLLVSKLPLLDGIVHNAGVGSRVLCKNITSEDFDKVIRPNFEAPVMLQSLILKKKKINKCASIVFTASRASEIPSIGNAMYSASKGAITSYAKCLSLELAPRRIRVNCICPAMVWTGLVTQGGVDSELLKEKEKSYPLKRYGKPDDIANLAIYLLSDASSWMTGSCIDITGGTIEL